MKRDQTAAEVHAGRFVVAAAIVMLLVLVPAKAQAGIDCYPLFPTIYQPNNTAVRNFAEHNLGDARTALQTARTENDLVQGLRPLTHAPQIQNANYPLWPWRAVLWAACQPLGDRNIRMTEFNKFALLRDVYLSQVSHSDLAPPNGYPPCSDERPLPDNAVRMWSIWMAYNNGLFDEVLREGASFEALFGIAANNANNDVHGDPRSGARCAILKRGVLNDTAAERWAVAQTLEKLRRTAEANHELDLLMCVDNGLVYDRHIYDFWRPSETVPPGHSCPPDGRQRPN